MGKGNMGNSLCYTVNVFYVWVKVIYSIVNVTWVYGKVMIMVKVKVKV